jgi:hypothetical protein
MIIAPILPGRLYQSGSIGDDAGWQAVMALHVDLVVDLCGDFDQQAYAEWRGARVLVH